MPSHPQKKPIKAWLVSLGEEHEIINAEAMREILLKVRRGDVFKIKGLGALIVAEIKPTFHAHHNEVRYRVMYM